MGSGSDGGGGDSGVTDTEGDPATRYPAGIPGSPDVRPLTLIRRVVARRMTQAALTIPAVTLHREVRFARLLERRRAMDPPPSVDILVAGAVARSLVTYELLNGSWMENPPAVLVHPERNVAVAVETTQGLTIVVLREADRRSEVELADVFQTMVERARAGRSEAADVEGATFTITNLGGLGIDGFTPIITPPQTGVLGIGAFRTLPELGRPATLSLTFDHRVVDGAYAARFLGDVVDRIEDGFDGRQP